MISPCLLEDYAIRGALRPQSARSSSTLRHGKNVQQAAAAIAKLSIRNLSLQDSCSEVSLSVSHETIRKSSAARETVVCHYATAAESERRQEEEEEDDDGARGRRGGRRSAAEETMDMLGWPSLCESVARFASTATGKQLCLGLAPPSTREESQALIDETAAALEIDGILGGVLDFGALQTPLIKAGLARVSRSDTISGNELAAIATLLQVAQTLQRGVVPLLDKTKGRKEALQPVGKLIEPMVTHQDFLKLVSSKLDEDGTVKDTASPQLRQARIQARTLEQRLQELLNKIAREKSEDVQEIVDVDGRLCLTVRSTAETSVPGLLFQQGSTTYLEPSQAVSLNSKLAEARSEVQSAERAVLSSIATRLRPILDDVHFDLHSIVQLDVIAARGKYSSSIGGRKPQFVNSHKLDQDSTRNPKVASFNDVDNDHKFLINLRKLRHPLLVEKYRQAVRKAKAKLKEKTKLMSRMMRSRGGSSPTTGDAMAEAEMEVAATEARAPVPIDVRVSAHTRVVAITGPNAGGKTAAIKATGLAALMAKVGLYVLAADPVHIPWFDAVFADIGDEQSLGQSLSTFSGHLLRIKRILAESTKDSLILLDELSAGTDPTEGAALGMALLEHFAAGGALLTLATTHHGELKTLKYSNDRFENACVEFNEESLAPTFKLLWGIPGRSNAINVARRQGLPSSVLSTAESLYGAASAELNEVIMELEEARFEFDQNCEKSESLVDETKEFYAQLVEVAGRLYEFNMELHEEKSEQLAAVASEAHSRVNALGRKRPQIVPKPLSAPVMPIKKKQEENVQRIVIPADEQVPGRLPRRGELVFVPKLGRSAEVVEVNEARKEITVKSGFLQIKLNLKEVR